MNAARNTSLDVLKGIAALFVIWIHEQFPGVTGQLITRVGMFAVPVFFMVSGCFSRNSDREKLGKSIRHILTLLAITYGLNLLRIVVFEGAAELLDALKDSFSPRNLLLLAVLNITHISGVAWFLFALLYCYILHWLFQPWMEDRRVYLLIPVCIAAGLAVRLFLPAAGTNNAWFCGIPCYLIGRWFRDGRVPTWSLMLGAALGLCALTASVFVMPVLAYPAALTMAAGLFGLCIRYPGYRNSLLGRVGSTYSFFVYIGHALMIHVFNAILPVGDHLLLAWTRPVLLAAATIGCAALWYDVIRRN